MVENANGAEVVPPIQAPLPKVVNVRRLGCFFVPVKAIESQPAAVRKVTTTVIITDARALWPQGVIMYTGLCEEFDPIPDGMNPPEYMAEMVTIIDGQPSFKRWVRQTPRHPAEGALVIPPGVRVS